MTSVATYSGNQFATLLGDQFTSTRPTSGAETACGPLASVATCDPDTMGLDALPETADVDDSENSELELSDLVFEGEEDIGSSVPEKLAEFVRQCSTKCIEKEKLVELL